MDEIQEYLTQRYPDAYINLKRYNLMFKKYPIEAPVSYTHLDVYKRQAYRFVIEFQTGIGKHESTGKGQYHIRNAFR